MKKNIVILVMAFILMMSCQVSLNVENLQVEIKIDTLSSDTASMSFNPVIGPITGTATNLYSAYAFPTLTPTGMNVYYTEATTHLSNGKLMRKTLVNDVWSDPEVLLSPPAGFHYIGISGGRIQNTDYVFFTRFNPATNEHDKMYVYDQTNLIELPFASGYQRFIFYSKLVASDVPGRYFITWLSHDLPLSVTQVHILQTDDYGVTWNSHKVFDGQVAIFATTFSEAALLKVDNTYVMLARNEQGKRLGIAYSNDECQTFTPFVATNLGNKDNNALLDRDNDGIVEGTVTSTKMADMDLDNNGNVIVMFHDRSDGFLKVSKTPKEQVLGSGMFNEPVFYFDNRPFPQTMTSFRYGLGYPKLINTGKTINGQSIFRAFWGVEGNFNSATIYTAEDTFQDIPMLNSQPQGVNITNDILSWDDTISPTYEVYKSDSDYWGNYSLVGSVNQPSFQMSDFGYYYVKSPNSERSIIRHYK